MSGVDAMARRPFQQLPFQSIPAGPRKPHSFFEIKSHEVTTKSPKLGELRVHYREFGEGPPLLLVHGLMTTSYSYRYVLDGLGARFRLIIPDLPGCGKTQAPPNGAFGPADLAMWIGDFQKATGIEGSAAIGNSMGGYLCMRHALESPGAFSRLVNIHSPAVPDLKLDALAAAIRLPGARRLAAALPKLVGTSRWVHKNVHYHDETLKSLEEAREYGDPLATPEGARAFAGYLSETMAASGLRAFLRDLEARKEAGRRFPCPLLLVYARQDPLVSPSNGEALHKLVPASELVWLDQTSHFAHVDSPERVVEVVLPFLTAS